MFAFGVTAEVRTELDRGAPLLARPARDADADPHLGLRGPHIATFSLMKERALSRRPIG